MVMRRYSYRIKNCCPRRLFNSVENLYCSFKLIYLLLLIAICSMLALFYNSTYRVVTKVITKTEYKNSLSNYTSRRSVVTETFNFSETEIAEIYSKIEKGGIRKRDPKNQHVAIIVPYRNRAEHLKIFLRTIHYFLYKQRINYGIFVVEQIQNQTFNKAKLMNAGFMEISKDEFWDCFIFHDVDLLPENKDIKYECNEKPTHFSSAVDKLAYQVWPALFGGVTGMRKEYFKKVNGYSNIFWGWGGEDEAMGMRIRANGDKFYDLPPEIGRYRMHKHDRDKNNAGKPHKCLLKLVNHTSQHYDEDGLTNLNYLLLNQKDTFLFKHFIFDLLEKESRRDIKYIC